ncbi:hypothetical protein LTR48_004391 [Friedmanniomyces endolithicus]|uniref:Uncharacterized protein n=1 Tax=Rachicladosporium monterosium TaxID=1507873 RepID=A0ABR0KY17_9PEZI|nr:hypothetical protein LTR48_004391 [Friedmanniomyces endolithicus]KAK5140472.1 hypothetical protein LTR32_006736 [Rachicladosporium monterosium]
MAEVAPLTTAHAHARKAAEETQHVRWTTAAEEHQYAASDFARAAKGTGDHEAFRILKQLEEQHQKLARLMRYQNTPEILESVVEQPTVVKTTPSEPTSPPTSTKPATKHRSPTSALAAARIDSQARASSPSLAREIASRRGIPQNGRSQPSAAAQARTRQQSPESPRSTRSNRASKIPPSIVDTQANLTQPKPSNATEEEDGFGKFYSSFREGTMSKLSSALAFAGLPLTADDIKPERKQTVTVRNDHDVRGYISEAALRALEEDRRQRGKPTYGFGPAESFYVVPPTGMMTSFADIARRRGLEDDEDDFVDAREGPGPTSPRGSSSGSHAGSNGGGGRISFGKTRTQEELELENSTLKLTLEQLASRLANFEAHAQDASMMALTQSMVSLRAPAPTSTPAPAPKSTTLAVDEKGDGDGALEKQLRLLREQVARDAEEKRKMQTHAERQARELRKWDVRYERLMSSALAKQQAKDMARKGEGVLQKDEGSPAAD